MEVLQAIMDDLAFFDATAQAELVRRKELKPIELVDTAIERIERLNPVLNAVVTPMYELARKAAAGPLPDSPFAGVPFLLKDLGAEYGGVRLTWGSAFLRDYVSECDSKLMVRLKRAGLIVLGKTNTPEFGMLPTAEPHLFGPSHNPWDTTRSTGGSSGGSRACRPRQPLGWLHSHPRFLLRPLRPQAHPRPQPSGPHYGDMLSGLVCEHAVTRSVRDSAALLDPPSGPDPGDPYWAPPPERPFIQEVGTSPGRLRSRSPRRASPASRCTATAWPPLVMPRPFALTWTTR